MSTATITPAPEAAAEPMLSAADLGGMDPQDSAILNDTTPEVTPSEPVATPEAAPAPATPAPATEEPEAEPLDWSKLEGEKSKEDATAPIDPKDTAAAEAALPETIGQLVRSNPALDTLLKADPKLNSELSHFARQAQAAVDTANNFKAVFPDSDTAKAARASLDQFAQLFPTMDVAQAALASKAEVDELGSLYYGADPNSPVQFLEKLNDMQYERDPQTGAYVLGDDRQPISNGAYDRIAGTIFSMQMERLAAGEVPGARNMTQDQREEFTAAVETVMNTLGLGKQAAAQPGRIDPEIASRLRDGDNARQRLQSIEQQQDASRQQAIAQDKTALLTGISGKVHETFSKVLEPTFGAYQSQKIIDDALIQAGNAAAADPQYQSKIQSIVREKGFTQESLAERTKFAMSWLNQRMRPLVENIAKTQGLARQSTQRARDAKQALQESRREPVSSGASPAGTRPVGEEVRTRAELKTVEGKLGRRLTDREILDL